MPGAAQHPGYVGDHQPDKPHRTNDTDHHRGHQRAGEQQYHAHEGDRHAQGGRDVIAKGEGIKRS
ncbi:hypothetical protein D3C76_1583860 [compost metagenome]